MVASADFTINGSAVPPELAVAASSLVTLSLLSASGADTVTWSIIGNHAHSATNPTITPAGTPLGKTATFTMPAGDAQAYLIQCQINGGVDSEGVEQSTYTKTAIVGVVNTRGVVPFAFGENFERSGTHGTTEALNRLAEGGTGLGDVAGPAGATAGNLPQYSSSTGKSLSDSGIPATMVEFAYRPPSTYTAASNDAALADARKCIITTRATAISLRIRLQASIAWLADTLLGGINTGAGTLTVTAEVGVTLNGSVTVPQNGWWWAKRTAANTWQCFTGGTGGGTGDLKADGTVPLTATWPWGNQSATGIKSLSYNAEVNNTGATPAISWTTGDLQKITLTADCAPTFAAAPAGIGWVQACAIQDTTPRTITWPGSVLGSPPQPSTVSGARTFYPLFYDGTNYHYVAGSSSASGSGGGMGFRFTFSTTTTDADPGAGTLRANNATLSSVTTLFVDLAEYAGTDVTAWLDSMDDLVGAIKGIVRLQSLSDPTKWIEYTLTGWTTATGYRKLTVAYKDGPGGILTTAGDTFVSFDAVGVAANLNNQALTNARNLSYNGEVATTGSTPAVNFTTGDLQKSTLNAATVTPTFTAPPGVSWIQWHVQQDGTGGRLVVFPGTVLGSPPQPFLGANAHTFYKFFWDGANYHYVPAIDTAGNEYDNGNSSTADTIAFANGTYQKSTLTGNCTFTFTAPPGVCTIQLKLIQDATGSRTVTWPALVIWPAGGAPTLSTVAGDQDIVSIYWDGTNYYGTSDKPIPDGRVAHWDDAIAGITSAVPSGGGDIVVDPALGLNWKGKNLAETTIAPHGDSGNTTKRRFVKFLTQPVRGTIAPSGSATIASFNCASLNGRAFVSGMLDATLHIMAQGEYTTVARYLVSVAVDGSSDASIAGTPALIAATGGGFSFASSAFTDTGTTVAYSATADATHTTQYFAYWEIDGFEI